MRNVLPISAFLFFLVGAAPAQDRIPVSTQARLATMDHLEALRLRDFTNVVSDAQSGHREAQYLMALACGEVD